LASSHKAVGHTEHLFIKLFCKADHLLYLMSFNISYNNNNNNNDYL